jgi:putative ABC transport system permease protein
MYNIRISLRNLWQNRSASIINVIGLSVALSSLVFIFSWVYNELSFDKHNRNYKEIYMLASEWNYSDGKSDFIMETPTPLGPYLKDNFPEVMQSTRFAKQFGGRFLETNNKKFLEEGLAIEPSFFDIFTVDFVSGDPLTVNDKPNSIFISQRLARKFFGKENPIKAVITFFKNPEEKVDYEVCGVYKDIPENSSIQFDFLIPISFDDADNWFSFGFSTFLLLPNEIDKADLNKKIGQFYDYENMGFDINWYLHSLEEMHFHSDFQLFVYHPGDIQYIYIFIIVGVFILLIAVLNFMGLISILISGRLKESGIRKILGASKIKVLILFLAEPLILVALSIYLTFSIIEVIQSSSDLFSGSILPNINQKNILYITALIAVGLIIGSISGFVPGLYIASVNPFKALHQHNESGHGRLRKYLIILQLSLSIVLLASAFLIQKQLNYIFHKDLGFKNENIIHIPLKDKSRENYSLLKQELLNNPMIKGVTNNSPLLSSGIEIPGWTWDGIGNDQKHSIARIMADCDFIKTFVLNLVQGENFSSDNLNSYKAIINQAAAKTMNMADPIHQHMQLNGQDYEIVGVVENFHSRHFSHQIRPTTILYQESADKMYVAYKADVDRDKLLNNIESVFEKYNPGIPFEYTFFSDDFAGIYRDESRMLKLLFYFVTAAFLILCFGLYGLSRQVAIRKTKEIGIRKVNGASILEVLLLFAKDFSIWVLIAIVIATPVAYLLMYRWLNNFVYKTGLSWWIFALSGLAALLITIITVCWQSWKAASRNPVDVLKYE